MTRQNRIRLTGYLVCATAGQAATVAEHLQRHIELTRAEAGCLEFEVRPTADPLAWQVVELFESAEAFARHQERATASEWGRATAGIERDYSVEELHG